MRSRRRRCPGRCTHSVSHTTLCVPALLVCCTHSIAHTALCVPALPGVFDAGAGRYFELHCTALMAELQYAVRKGEYPDAVFVVSPPTGDDDVRIEGSAYTFIPKPSGYGEADMIVPVQARRYGDADAQRLIVTIDTDSLVQCLMLGMTGTEVSVAALQQFWRRTAVTPTPCRSTWRPCTCTTAASLRARTRPRRARCGRARSSASTGRGRW